MSPPIQARLSHALDPPKKSFIHPKPSSLHQYNLLECFNEAALPSASSPDAPAHLSPGKLTQTKITRFFPGIPKPCASGISPQAPPIPNLSQGLAPSFRSARPHIATKKHTSRTICLTYNQRPEPSTQPKLFIPISSSMLEAWGHALQPIDTSSVFHLFLQNPNGIKLRRGFHIPLQDLHTCREYGIAAICLPETNVNWALSHQKARLSQLQKDTWLNSSTQTSRATEEFLSSSQLGDTATIICGKWATRVLEKGKDHLGLGRWSYITLRGKKGRRLTIVSAYNCGISSGAKTACQQQT
jgi:hypothetical protein